MLKYAFLSVDGIDIKPTNIFTGSAIRGCFGYALKQVVCPFINLKCDNCPKSYNCIFYKIYENKNTTPNVRFEVFQNSYDFKFFMFEEMCKIIPYFIVAFENMQSTELGYKKEKFKFKRILLNGKIIYEDRVLLTKEFRSLNFRSNFKENNIKVNLKTPLRIKQDGKIVTHSLNLEKFLKGIKWHYNSIKKIDEKLNYTPKFKEFTQNLKFVDFDRYSNRQRIKHEFGGVVGELKVFDLDDEGIWLLEIASIIGAGKSTVFGLGSIIFKGVK